MEMGLMEFAPYPTESKLHASECDANERVCKLRAVHMTARVENWMRWLRNERLPVQSSADVNREKHHVT